MKTGVDIFQGNRVSWEAFFLNRDHNIRLCLSVDTDGVRLVVQIS